MLARHSSFVSVHSDTVTDQMIDVCMCSHYVTVVDPQT